MKKLKIPISRFKLSLSLLLITTFLMIIKKSMNHHENGTLDSILSSVIHWVFFISLFFVFLEKKRLFFIIFIVFFSIFFIYFHFGFDVKLQRHDFESYIKNHPNLLQSCMKEEYHNPEKQTLAYCFTNTHDDHGLDTDVFYDSGNEFARPYVERSCDWWRAFDALATKSSPSRLHNFNSLETIRDMNISIFDLGHSYYSVSYSFEFLYISPENKKACK
ncbi:MAG: hypothetical protein ABN480_11140 [Dickeya sp.]